MQSHSFSQSLHRNLVSLSLLLLLLYLGRHILVPLAFGGLFALALATPCNFIEDHGFSRGMSSLLSIILFALIGLALAWIVAARIDSIKEGLSVLTGELSAGILHVSTASSLAARAMPDPGSLLQGTFSFLSGTLTDLVLIPVYTFLLLYYRDLFVRFLVRTIGGAQPADLLAMLTKVRLLTRQYVGGLLIEMLIIASLNAVGFFIVGMKYALLSALIVALLNLIPYLGIFMACALSLLINVHNNPPGIALRVIGVLLAVHLLDAYLIYPKIVGSKVRINALAVIVGVVTGGTLWGIPGMFLALPAIAMLKAILEESDNLQPWGLLLGGNITGSHPASKDSAEKNPTDSTDP